MAYSPSISYEASCTLRRIAWALEVPMTQALEEVIQFVVINSDSIIVCKSCQDKSKCKHCGYRSNSTK